MGRASGIQLFFAESGKYNEDSFPIRTTALNERSFLHARQLMRQAALIPSHHAGERLLPHLPIPKRCETRQDPKLRPRKSGRLRNVPPNPAQHIFVHEPEGMPDTKHVWR